MICAHQIMKNKTIGWNQMRGMANPRWGQRDLLLYHCSFLHQPQLDSSLCSSPSFPHYSFPHLFLFPNPFPLLIPFPPSYLTAPIAPSCTVSAGRTLQFRLQGCHPSLSIFLGSTKWIHARLCGSSSAAFPLGFPTDSPPAPVPRSPAI